jgi:hypothetical protein
MLELLCVSGFKSAKEDLATANQTDAFKNFVDNEEFENYIESFKTLPGYKTYGKQLKEYKNVSCPAQEQLECRGQCIILILSCTLLMDHVL